MLRSKGFFFLAHQQDLVWEWSTAGESWTHCATARCRSGPLQAHGQPLFCPGTPEIQTLTLASVLCDSLIMCRWRQGLPMIGILAWPRWGTATPEVQPTDLKASLFPALNVTCTHPVLL